MDSALAWIGQLAQWFGQFFPRWTIVIPQRRGIKYVRGRKVVVCEPGIHWFWPVTTLWQDWPVMRQGVSLPSQTMVTVDDKTIEASGMLIYSVSDIETFMLRSYSPDHLVQEIALTAIHDVCCSMTWDELKGEQRKGTLDTKLKNAAKAQLKDYGVEVVKCMLTTLGPSRILKLVQASAELTGVNPVRSN